MARIAIIEDDQAIAQMYRFKFEADGDEVEVADNGRIGLQLIKEFKPDMVLTDLMMPEMTGEEMLIELRKQTWGEKVKVIVLTNRGEQEIPDVVKTLDITAVILKADMTPRQVADVVRQALGQPSQN